MKHIIIAILIISLTILVGCKTETTTETCNIITGECSGETKELTPTEQNCKDNQGFLDEREETTYCIFKDGTECAVEECKFEETEETTPEETSEAPEEETTPEVEEVEEIQTTQNTIITVKEGELVKLNVEAVDADGDKLTYKFDAPLNNNGEWQTKEGDEGNYEVEITVSDGEETATTTILVVVEALNKAPTLKVEDVTVNEGETVTLNIETNDAEGDEVIVTVFSTKFTQDGNTFTWTTNYHDAGSYDIKVEASDGKSGVSETITVTVKDKNRAPIITGITQE